MPYVVKDRVKVTSTTTGTGTFTLGAAATGFQSFASLGTNSGWNISTAQVLQSFAVGSQDTSPRGLFFKPDGLKMYVVGDASPEVNEYNLSTAWDVRTSSFLQTFSISAQGTSARGLFFRSDGLKMYVVFDGNETVAEYDLSSAWNISTASYLQNFSVAGQNTQPRGIFFKPDGLKMYVAGGTVDEVNEYDLSSAWNISTASFLQVYAIAQDNDVFGLFFKPDGLGMYITGGTNSSVYQYSLSSAWNISTASYVRALSVLAQESLPQSVFFKPDGSVMYVNGPADNDRVWQYLLSSNQTYYCIANGTDWEVGVGTVSDDGLSLSRDTVLESSNSNALVNWSAGSKDVFCTFPSDATEGTVPTADNSSVGTDLYAWTNLKKQLDAGVINGVPYNNNNTAGMVSTYSLVYTTPIAYRGGVLSPTGDIHFIPFCGIRGQKISSSGVVSTYSLVYTNNNGAYVGGVLAPNGDIHFVPYEAVVGQKINASGVVSTYSLVYTALYVYSGGVLAPNGDVHFVPHAANRGQKISPAGVVSTYSLVYTASAAYIGGVLAPNGDIHFVPFNANRGQKISAAGVVSTYSLVYTTLNAYSGGVLASNGDIHFIPANAAVGQKISPAGVVSTYSLAYTASDDPYFGGVLSPGGDIYFIPQSAPRGQKISATGVASTYSLVYTAVNAYSGGILTPTGEIFFVPYSANRGQKISTNTTRPIGYALSPFFNKF